MVRRCLRPTIALLLILAVPTPQAHAQAAPLPPAVTAAPDMRAAGLDPEAIHKLLELIRTTPPNDFRGLVVIKNDQLVVEEYFNTYWRETVHDIRSAGKSVTGILLGIAIDKGLIKDVDQPVRGFFPQPKGLAPTSDRTPTLRIRHLLSMSSGLAADDDDETSPGNTSNWFERDDWVDFLLRLPARTDPGTDWVYTDVSPILIGAIIEKVSGQTLSEFARQNLFTPLGIREYYWYTGHGGSTGAAGNLYITALDFAHLGELMLSGGRWKGRQIVSEAWVRELVKQRFDVSKSNPFATGYGYFWWLGKKTVADHTYPYYFASGNGGNLLFVVPEERLVVSLTSSAYGQGYGHKRANNIFESVLKALVHPAK